MNESILITGAFGFVGTNLSKNLKTEFKCHLTAIDIRQPAKHFYDAFYTWHELDRIDWKAVDVVIHLAGKAHDTKNASADKEYFDINVELTKIIFEYFLKSGAEKFIFFSSVKAVADTITGTCLTEGQTPNPQTPYGKSKLEAEKHILGEIQKQSQTERRRSITSGKKVYIIRPCMIHGPGNKGNLNLLYKLVSKGIPWPLGAFKNQRSYTSIDNLVFVIRQLLGKDIKSGIFQMADDNPVSINRLIELITASHGKKARIWNINKRFIMFMANLGDTLSLPFNNERLKKLTESYVVSNSKLKKALSIDKMPLGAEDGLQKTLISFKKKA
jgi:nucleoside-diphosphate-sugar epimerase